MQDSTLVDNYIATQPEDVQVLLQNIRHTIQEVVPSVEEKITYGVPAFTFNGKTLLNYAAFSKHIGFYPGPEAIKAFAPELKEYETAPGTIRFPLDKPIPFDLMRQITQYCVNQRASKIK
jgi:uncharacterized protein YdhG (YjbR/CyaY superfamily)